MLCMCVCQGLATKGPQSYGRDAYVDGTGSMSRGKCYDGRGSLGTLGARQSLMGLLHEIMDM